MAERRIYAKIRFEWDAADDSKRSDEVDMLMDDIAVLLPHEWQNLNMKLVSNGEVDDDA